MQTKREPYDIRRAHNCAPIINPRCAAAILAFYADAEADPDDSSVPTPTAEQEKAMASFVGRLKDNLARYLNKKG